MSTASVFHDAAAYAARLHANQHRNDGRTPYFCHPARVALTVAARLGCTDETVLAAAVLHDVIEDTPADYDDLLERFGRDVADLVACLSKDARMIECDREADYDRRLSAGPWQARLIKLADVYDNLRDATTAHARRKLLGKAKRAVELASGDETLRQACGIVREFVEEMEQESSGVTKQQSDEVTKRNR